MTMNYQPYIIRDPAICGWKPVVKGTRLTVRTVLGCLAEGMTVTENPPGVSDPGRKRGACGNRLWSRFRRRRINRPCLNFE